MSIMLGHAEAEDIRLFLALSSQFSESGNVTVEVGERHCKFSKLGPTEWGLSISFPGVYKDPAHRDNKFLFAPDILEASISDFLDISNAAPLIHRTEHGFSEMFAIKDCSFVNSVLNVTLRKGDLTTSHGVSGVVLGNLLFNGATPRLIGLKFHGDYYNYDDKFAMLDQPRFSAIIIEV